MPKHKSITAIIPAAGMGRRMKSYGAKSLIDLHDQETILGRQIKFIKSCVPHISEIMVVVGFDKEKVIKSIPRGIKIIENENYQTTSVVRSIAMALHIATYRRVLIIYGDLVFNMPTLALNYRNGSFLVVDSHQQIGENKVGINEINGRIHRLEFNLEPKWTQIMFLTGKELKLFENFVWQQGKSKLLSHEALNDIIEHGGKLTPIEPKGMQIVEINFSKDIERARCI